ncbi:hypothetical protein S7711_07330 [Stachybotrys chartarum IBT 7711]|uniref:ER-bound oxygenase mpaB/mpaB'/Rubber oxygenase catalytic domain-containing protein n=1 Tax=Stachybotrys chartarum (strain CBS 109288 / IBT 7711) TaxID=1280523 RepID=A0A084AZH5_STACB|nr:hypothetical protein S7711_07330 [Stachybotrys chartarum IBT 7711]
MLFSTPTDDDKRVVWGHPYKWTEHHTSASDLNPLLFSYDKLAVDALNRLDEISPPVSKTWKCPHAAGPGQRDLYELLERHSAENETLARLWNEVMAVPEWVDWEQIQRGQQVFYQFSSQIMFGVSIRIPTECGLVADAVKLLYTSLVGGMGAYRVVETLGRTGGFGVRVARRRLLETLQHFMDMIDDVDSIKPGGRGFVSSVRVRLLHAAVRRRIMQLEKEKPGYFDMKELGVPINDLHCICTITAYSCAIVWLALPRQGVRLSRQQAVDFLAMWRWVGYVMGTPVDWMATPEQAKAMMESVMACEIQPSANSKILANNILTAEAMVPPLFLKREYMTAITYQLNGYDLSQALDIDKPSIKYRAIVWFQCFAFICLGHLHPWLPASTQNNMKTDMKRLVQKMITGHKNEMMGDMQNVSKFEFQYIPELGKGTELGYFERIAATSRRPWMKAWLIMPVVGLAAFSICWLMSLPVRGLPLRMASLAVSPQALHRYSN